MGKKIVVFFLQIDQDAVKGGIGTALAVGLPFIKVLTVAFQFIGAFAGLILLYLSIRHKILEIKKLKDGNTK